MKNILKIMKTLDSNIQEISDESSKDFDERMNLNHKEIYEQAKRIVSPTAAQIKLCDDLVDCGAGFELKEPHKNSMEAANLFIKKNYHLLKSPKEDSPRATRKKKTWAGMTGHLGGVGSERHEAFYRTNVPSDYDIPNH